MKIDRVIFREYDIRGIVDKQINNDFAIIVGKAFGSYIRKSGLKSVIVACDNRKSSPELKKHFIDGLSSCGCSVLDAQMIPTPFAYFAQRKNGIDACAVITASHNPPEFNGFSFVVGTHALYGKEIQKIADIIENEDFEYGKGEVKEIQVDDDYVNFMKERFNFKRKMRVGVDTGNGIAGPFIKKLFLPSGLNLNHCILKAIIPFQIIFLILLSLKI